MCGRFNFVTLADEQLEDIQNMLYEIQRKVELNRLKNGDLYPSDLAAVFLPDGSSMEACAMHWGFPGFKGKQLVINARSETVLGKPMFRDSVLSRRCIIPTTGFYEWQESPNDAQLSLFDIAAARKPKKKTKYLFRLPGTGVLYLAGVYNRFHMDDGQEQDRFVILTTEANRSMEDVHNRMPVVLRPEEWTAWLSESIQYDRFFDRKDILLERTAV